MAQQSRLGTHATTVCRIDGELVVTYHSTAVVRANSERILLDTGGHFSSTTKTRMNQASRQFELGYGVYQRKGKWFVDYNGKTIGFNSEVVELPKEAA
jgi:hypothetical protein